MKLAAVVESGQYTWAKFIAFFTCQNCSKSVSAVGTATIPIPKAQSGKEIGIKVEYFSPPVPMFTLVSTTPQSINKELLQAFSHFHSDLTASGGKLRRATEQFCTELGYKNGSLHKRIEEMKASYPTEANWLQSLKLVGNEATHADGIEEADLLHSFEVFEVLLDIFRKRTLEAKIQKTVLQLDTKFKKA